MTQIQFRLVAILLLIGLASAQIDNVVNIMSYNPVATGITVPAGFVSEDKLRYMFRRDVAAVTGPPAVAASFQIVSVRYNPASVGNQDVITYSQADTMTIKAVSRSHTCAVAYDTTTAKVIKFDTATLTATVVQDLAAAGGFTITFSGGAASDITTAGFTMGVADDCAAIQIGSNVYHSNPTGTTFLFASATTAGSTPAWAGAIAYSEDYSVAVGDTGIFKYTVVASPASRSYAAAGTFSPAL